MEQPVGGQVGEGIGVAEIEGMGVGEIEGRGVEVAGGVAVGTGAVEVALAGVAVPVRVEVARGPLVVQEGAPATTAPAASRRAAAPIRLIAGMVSQARRRRRVGPRRPDDAAAGRTIAEAVARRYDSAAMTRWAGSGAVGIALSIPGSLPAETGIGGTQILEAYRLDAPGAYLEPHALIAGNPAWAAFTGSHLWADAVDSVDQRRTDTRKGYSVLSNLSAAVDVPRRWHDADWKAFALASAGRSSSGVPERRSYVQAAPGHSYAQRYEWNRGTGFGRLEVGLAARRPSGALGLSLVADCAGDRGFSSSAQLSETTVGPDLYRFAYRFESRGASRDLKIGLGLGAVRRVWPRWAVEQTLRYETATSRFHGHYAYGLEYDYGGWKHSESFDFEFAGESRRHDVVLRVGAIRTAADRWWLRAGTEGRWSQSSGRFRAWGPAVPSGWAGQASARQRRLELRWLRVEGAYRAQNTDTFLFAHIGSREARFALSSGGSCWGWGAEQPLFGRRFHVVFRRPMLPCEPSWLRTYGVRSILDFIVFGYSEVSVRLATHRSISTELSLVYRWRGGRLEPETARIVAGVAW